MLKRFILRAVGTLAFWEIGTQSPGYRIMSHDRFIVISFDQGMKIIPPFGAQIYMIQQFQ